MTRGTDVGNLHDKLIGGKRELLRENIGQIYSALI